MHSKRHPRLIAALLPALLAGCMTESGEGPLVGESLSAVQGARVAAFLDGRLYVANRDGDATGIVAVDPATDLVVGFHKETLPPIDLAVSGDSILVVSESDFSVGSLSRLNVKTGKWEPSYQAVDSDNALSSAGDRVFLMERRLGVVTGFTDGRLEEAKVFLNVQTGARANPHQAALYGKTLFVTRYGRSSLLVLEADRRDGGKADSIDLSAYVADGLKGDTSAAPQMDAVVLYGKRLFVTVQRLNGFKALDTSKVIVIDADSRKVVGEIALLRKNPVAVAVRGKHLFVSCVEGYGSFTGAVERIDMEKEAHAGMVIEEKDLVPPSDIVHFMPVSDSKGYAVFTPDFAKGYIQAVPIP